MVEPRRCHAVTLRGHQTRGLSPCIVFSVFVLAASGCGQETRDNNKDGRYGWSVGTLPLSFTPSIPLPLPLSLSPSFPLLPLLLSLALSLPHSLSISLPLALTPSRPLSLS